MQQIDIFNLTLSHLGEVAISQYPETGSLQRVTDLITTFASSSLDETIQLHPWNECKTRNWVESSSLDYSGSYTYAYLAPTESIEILSTGETFSTAAPEYGEIEGEYFWSNNSSPLLFKYTKAIPLTSLKQPTIDVYTRVLAKNMVKGLNGDDKLRIELIKELEQTYLPRSKYKNDRNLVKPVKNDRSRWSNARTNYYV